MQNRNVFVAGGIRTPFVRSMGKYRDITTQDLMTESLKKLVEKYQLQGRVLGDVALGAVMNSSSNWNLARECSLGSGLHPYTPAYNVVRACGTGLEAALQIALKISSHQMDSGIAGGVDTNSDLPIMVSHTMAQKLLALNMAKSAMEKIKILASIRFHELKPTYPAVVEPRTGLSMGEHCEKMVKEWKISQSEQDELAYLSHRNGQKAYDEKFYEDLVFTFRGSNKDGTLRGDTTQEKLAKLKPVFDRSPAGTLTAGNSTPLTDGSSAVLLVSESGAKELNVPKLARFVDAQVAGVDFVGGDGLLMAPTVAVARLLERNNLTLQDFDFYEIHEAFAGQVLCTLKAWESPEYCKRMMGLSKPLGSIDRSKMNIKGGSVALGHPFAATGGRIISGLAKLLQQKGSGRGLISICTGGGMGVTAILEAV